MSESNAVGVLGEGVPSSVIEALREECRAVAVARHESPSAAIARTGGDLDAMIVSVDSSADGRERIRRVREAVPPAGIVLFARDHDPDLAATAVNAGVDRYVVAESIDEATVAETIDAVEAVVDGARDRELERYRTVVEASGDPVYTLDSEGYVTFANEALAELTGYDVEQIVGHHVAALLKRDHVERGNRLIRDLLADEERTKGTFELTLERRDGETLRCENHVALLPGGEFRGTVGVLRDVTERHRRANELAEERDRMNAIFETIPEPLAHVSYEGTEPRVEAVNSAFEDVFGFGVGDVEGETPNDAIVPESVLDEARRIDASTGDRDFLEREVERKTVDGVRDFLLRMTRFDAGDRDGEAIVAYVDVTQQKERQRELERHNRRLDRFASVVSHDLRSPLTVASGRLELLAEECSSSHVDSIGEALDRMDALIEDALSLAKHGEPVTEQTTLDLASVAESSWRHVDAAEATVTVTDGLRFVGHRSRVQSVFENLFGNAVEHAGPDVTITVESLEDGFAVEDDGPGLPTDEDLFAPGVTTDPDGTGFGLSIVEEVVRAHGWSIRATEGADGGARFEITGVETEP
ncbi:MAG: PAS domain S-box protein [Halanaeroarchaeum sp.]